MNVDPGKVAAFVGSLEANIPQGDGEHELHAAGQGLTLYGMRAGLLGGYSVLMLFAAWSCQFVGLHQLLSETGEKR